MTEERPANPRTSDLRHTFNTAANRYHRARPRYPDALLDALCGSANLGAGSSVVEVGPATGVATEQLAGRGMAVTAVELGEDLAAEAAANLQAFPNVAVINHQFETWEGPKHSFDAVLAATMWHWLDPDLVYDRAHRLLKPDHYLAFWSATHVFPEDRDPIFEQLQATYDRLGMSTPQDWEFPRPGRLPAVEVPSAAPFEPVMVQQFDWELSYDADSYIDLLSTFSGHIALSDDVRAEIFEEIRFRLSRRPDGLLRRHWGAVLQVHRAT